MSKFVSASALRASLFTALLACAVCGTASGQTLSAPWITRDVGAPTLAGRATLDAGVLSIEGAGTGIRDKSDQFRFVYQVVSGDFDMVARIDSLQAGRPEAAVALMIRASLYHNAAHAAAVVSPGGETSSYHRATNGSTTAVRAGGSAGAPVWLRAVRRGTTVATSRSANGTSWTTLGSHTVALGASAYVGFTVTGGDAGASAAANVSGIALARYSLPSGQGSMDIGAPALKGRAAYSGGAYTFTAAGADIWGSADQFRFVYQPVSGDVELVARIASIEHTHRWAKAGVMIRESLTAESRHAMMLVSAANGYAFQRRPEPATDSLHTPGGAGTAPAWVKLVRRGDLFEAYTSADGSSWSRVGSDTIPMTDTVYVGLAVTSHDATAATTAVLDRFTVTAAGTANRPPAISLTSPVVGASFSALASVVLTASASDPENRLAAVDFYAGSTLIARDTTAPYAASWAASPAGTHTLSATAHDADGGSSTSSAVTVTVRAPNQAPSVSLSAGTLALMAGESVTLTATASDPEGHVSRVDFYNGTVLLGSDAIAPYSFSWSGVTAGVYTLHGVVRDAAGASASSAAVVITVGPAEAPSTTAPRLVVFTASPDHATLVASYVLRVYAAGAQLAGAPPLATSDLGKPAPGANQEITVDRSAFFSSLPAGSYVATVTAAGPGGQSQSASIAFTR